MGAKSKKSTGENLTDKVDNRSTMIKDFIRDREMRLHDIETHDESTIPITIRMESITVALLDHLVEKWKDTRSAIASELLEKVIQELFREVYREKTNDEIFEMHKKLYFDFVEKRKKGRKK